MLASQFGVSVDRVNAGDHSYIIDVANKAISKAFVVGYILGRSEVSKLVKDNIVESEEYAEVPESCSKLITKLVNKELKKVKR